MLATILPAEGEPVLKRIAVSDLLLGMYVDEFCGSWMDHPFWRAGFVVSTDVDLRRIQESGISEVWIDSGKGLDIEAGVDAIEGHESTDARIEAQLRDVAATAKQRTRRNSQKVDALKEASRVLANSRQVVAAVFGEARMGSVRDTGDAAGAVDNIAESVARNPAAIIGLARLKSADDYTFMHSVAVCALMVALARTLGFDEKDIRIAGMAGLLHDVGKAQIPLSVLNKPGALDDKEWETMRSHPERGYQILREARGATPAALEAVLHHHEKVDGTGYPHKLSGRQITQLTKMTTVCDVYDAITSDRPYKAGWQPTVALRKMAEWANGHFDDSIFKAFVKTVGIYPIGSLVRLKSDRLAVVVAQDDAQLLEPTVKAFFSLRSKMHITPTTIQLGKSVRDRIISIEDPEAHGLKKIEELWAPNAVAA